MRIFSIVAILLLLTGSGCSVMSPLPTSANTDPNVGGGQISPANPDYGSDPDAGGGIAAPEGNASSSQPGLSGVPLVDLPMTTPGEAIKQGNLTFTIGLVQVTEDQMFLEYTIRGLATDYQPLDKPKQPAILLPDGRLIPPIRDEGSGSPGSETVQAVFPPLPKGTDIFLLLLENRWNGTDQTWRVPVTINPQ